MKLAKVLLAFAVFFLAVSPSVADVTYVYVGNDFTLTCLAILEYTTNNHITFIYDVQ